MIKGLASYLLIVLSLIVIILAGLNHIYAINEAVTSGRAYGLTIGKDKVETYKYIVEHELSNSYGHIQGGKKGDRLAVFTIKESSYYLLKQHDKWHVIYGNSISYDNTLEIAFNDDKIISLTRQRQIANITPYFLKSEKILEKIFSYLVNIFSDSAA